MADEVTLPRKDWRRGSKKYLRVRITEEKNQDLSTLTATFDLYDLAATHIVDAGAMAVAVVANAAFKSCIVSYLLDSGDTKPLDAVGDYNGFVTATIGGEIYRWKVPIHLYSDTS